jgi:hypothetical protein
MRKQPEDEVHGKARALDHRLANQNRWVCLDEVAPVDRRACWRPGRATGSAAPGVLDSLCSDDGGGTAQRELRPPPKPAQRRVRARGASPSTQTGSAARARPGSFALHPNRLSGACAPGELRPPGRDKA